MDGKKTNQQVKCSGQKNLSQRRNSLVDSTLARSPDYMDPKHFPEDNFDQDDQNESESSQACDENKVRGQQLLTNIKQLVQKDSKGLRKRDAKAMNKKPYTVQKDLQINERENSIFNESRASELDSLKKAALAKFDEQIKKKQLKQPGIDKKVYEEIQKHKENRPYVKRYLEEKPYFIVIFKKEILEKVPIEYLQDWVRQQGEDLRLHGQMKLQIFWAGRAQLLLAPLENVLVLYNDRDLIASIKFKFHFSQGLREMISYGHLWDRLKSEELNQFIQYLIKICEKQVCSSLLFFTGVLELKRIFHANQYIELEGFQKADREEFHQKQAALVMKYVNTKRMVKMTPSPPAPTEADVTSWTRRAQEAYKIRKAWMEKFTQEQVKEICWDGYNKCKKGGNIETANPTEQAGTPEEIFDYIFNITFTKKEDWHDPCPLDPNFCSTTNACAQAEERIWSYLTYVNPPFDKSTLFVRKALQQWREHRCNIALVLPSNSTTAKYFQQLFDSPGLRIAEMSEDKLVKFEGFSRKAPFPIKIVTLLQPEFIEKIERNKQRLNLNKQVIKQCELKPELAPHLTKELKQKGPRKDHDQYEQWKLTMKRGLLERKQKQYIIKALGVPAWFFQKNVKAVEKEIQEAESQ